MKKLDRNDTVLLLITRNWEHKNVPKKIGESIQEYAKKVFAYQNATDPKFITDTHVRIFWNSFARNAFNLNELRDFLELTTIEGFEPVRAIIAIAQVMDVTDLELDQSDIRKPTPFNVY